MVQENRQIQSSNQGFKPLLCNVNNAFRNCNFTPLRPPPVRQLIFMEHISKGRQVFPQQGGGACEGKSQGNRLGWSGSAKTPLSVERFGDTKNV